MSTVPFASTVRVGDRIDIEFCDESAFRRFVEGQLRRGRVVAPTSLQCALFAPVTLGVTAGDRTIDLEARVLNSAITKGQGRMVELDVQLKGSDWSCLEWVINALTRTQPDATAGPTGLDEEIDPIGRRWCIDDTLARDVLADSHFDSKEAGRPPGLMDSDPEEDSLLPIGVLEALAEDVQPGRSSGWGVSAEPWLDDSRFGFDAGPSGAAASSAVGPTRIDEHRTHVSRGVVGSEQARRAAAAAHLRAAQHALTDGDIADAHAWANLAIASDPTNPTCVRLVEVIERRLRDDSGTGRSRS